MKFFKKNRVFICVICACLFSVTVCCALVCTNVSAPVDAQESSYIKWFEFDATNQILTCAMNNDIASKNDGGVNIDWIEVIAVLATKNGGKLSSCKTSDVDEVCGKMRGGKTAVEISGSEKYYNYYYEGYSAALGGLVGYYEIEEDAPDGSKQMTRKYGLKGFSPIAKGYGFSHYDDFGAGRTYGFARKHLGNDLMGSVGTPIIAVESGVVEALGWNMYGGWRIGIRSLDGMRYYYYAHLRKDRPYHASLFVGKTVTAGDVIGYLGMSGYSTKENTNNINVPHLHFGLELIFDESQKESNNEIWIDMYEFVEFLEKNKSSVIKDENKEYNRVYMMRDPAAYE